jgi:hypothetical protein
MFGAAIALLAGSVQASATRFFAGLLLALGCWMATGLIKGDAYNIVIVGPLMALWVLGVTGLSFAAGKAIGLAISRLKKYQNDT